jgi:hypothetical protein
VNNRRCLATTALVVWAACQRLAIAQGQQSAPDSALSVSTSIHLQADSAFALVRARIKARDYRIDQVDALRHRLVVRPPDHDTKVEIRITPSGDSSTVTITSLGAGSPTTAIQAIIMVSMVGTMESPSEATPTTANSGTLPESRWRPELFVSPEGRFWMARGGLYAADSLRGNWRRVFQDESGAVAPDDLRIGISMAFVDTNTFLLGLPAPAMARSTRLIFRSTNAGASWVAVPAAGITGVDDMSAIGASVWIMATRWVGARRRGAFLRSHDGGQTWERPALPARLNDITHLYRVSPQNAYVATAGYNGGSVFWHTLDSGGTWSPVPTPSEQGIHHVPPYGSRVEEIATVGKWLLVREYGAVFVSRADTIHWARLDGVEYVAPDLSRDQLFVLTDSLRAATLDRDLGVLWQSEDRIPYSWPTNIEKVLARDGVGFVCMSRGAVYEARAGLLSEVWPRATAY